MPRVKIYLRYMYLKLITLHAWERGKLVGSVIIIVHKNRQILGSRHPIDFYKQRICPSWWNTGFSMLQIEWCCQQASQYVFVDHHNHAHQLCPLCIWIAGPCAFCSCAQLAPRMKYVKGKGCQQHKSVYTLRTWDMCSTELDSSGTFVWCMVDM